MPMESKNKPLVLQALAGGPRKVNEICESTGLANSAVATALQALLKKGTVKVEKGAHAKAAGLWSLA